MGGALVGSPCRILGPRGTYPNREKGSNFQSSEETRQKYKGRRQKGRGFDLFVSFVTGGAPPVRLLLTGNKISSVKSSLPLRVRVFHEATVEWLKFFTNNLDDELRFSQFSTGISCQQ
jgi:hypothetical protein